MRNIIHQILIAGIEKRPTSFGTIVAIAGFAATYAFMIAVRVADAVSCRMSSVAAKSEREEDQTREDRFRKEDQTREDKFREDEQTRQDLYRQQDDLKIAKDKLQKEEERFPPLPFVGRLNADIVHNRNETVRSLEKKIVGRKVKSLTTNLRLELVMERNDGSLDVIARHRHNQVSHGQVQHSVLNDLVSGLKQANVSKDMLGWYESEMNEVMNEYAEEATSQ